MSRPPCPLLRPFVRLLWASDGTGRPRQAGARELVLPTGLAQLVVRLSSEPIVLFEGGAPRALGHAVLGGARAGYYEKDVSAPSEAIGATLLPGAIGVLFGARADELSERHTPLGELWGGGAARLRERLAEERSAERRLGVLERFLLGRARRAPALPPGVAAALARLSRGEHRIGALVQASGSSHRALIAAFRAQVGLAPKAYANVLRFQRALRALHAPSAVTLAQVALAAGYADQAHLTRAFAELAGVSPARYRALGLAEPNHVPLGRAPARGPSAPHPCALGRPAR